MRSDRSSLCNLSVQAYMLVANSGIDIMSFDWRDFRQLLPFIVRSGDKDVQEKALAAALEKCAAAHKQAVNHNI